nr:ECF transporter S component [bacterium]
MAARQNVYWLTKVAMLTAVAVVLKVLQIPMPFLAPWLQLDFGEMPAILAALGLGPLAGLAVVVLTNAIHFLISPVFGGVGQLANILIGTALVIPSGLIYRYRHTFKGALLALVVAYGCMIVMGVVSNLYLLLPAAGLDLNQPNPFFPSLSKYIIAGVLPFNAIKGVCVCGLVLLLYKHLSPLLHWGNKA